MSATINKHRLSFHKVSQAFGDTVLLLLVSGVVGERLWSAYIAEDNWVALLYVSGFIGGLFAYFGFMLFGALYVFKRFDGFWYSLHPFNFGICLVVWTIDRLSERSVSITWAIGIGVVAAVFLLPQHVFKRERIICAACLLALPIGRFVIDRDWRLVASYCFGVLVLAVMMRMFLESRNFRSWRDSTTLAAAPAAPLQSIDDNKQQ